MERMIDGPEHEWVTLGELSSWLGVGTRALKAMIANGEIPPPIKMTSKTHRWHWRDAIGISIAMSWRQRIAAAHEAETHEKQRGKSSAS